MPISTDNLLPAADQRSTVFVDITHILVAKLEGSLESARRPPADVRDLLRTAGRRR